VVKEGIARRDDGESDEEDTFVKGFSFEVLLGSGEQDDEATELPNQGKNRPIAAQLFFYHISYSPHSKKDELLS
jgi:hypothetical protein